MPRKLNVNWDDQPLGEMYDYEIARIVGCTTAYVGDQRNRRGIPPYHPYAGSKKSSIEKCDTCGKKDRENYRFKKKWCCRECGLPEENLTLEEHVYRRVHSPFEG